MVYIVHTLDSKSRVFFISVLHLLSKKEHSKAWTCCPCSKRKRTDLPKA